MYVVVVVENMYRGQETAQRRSFCQIGYETPYIQKKHQENVSSLLPYRLTAGD
jgi:hypothetical protein